MDEDGEDTDMEKERLEAEGMQMRCAITWLFDPFTIPLNISHF